MVKLYLISSFIQLVLALLDGNMLFPERVYQDVGINSIRQIFSLLFYPGYVIFKGEFEIASVMTLILLNTMSFCVVILPVYFVIRLGMSKGNLNN